MFKKIIILVVILLVLGGGIILIKNNNSAEKSSVNVKLVRTEEAAKETLITKASADGNIKAEKEKELKAPLLGIIEKIYVESADLVAEGDKLYSIDDRTLKSSLETALLTLEEIKADYKNLSALYNNQTGLNNLKLKEADKNLEIALLSYQQEKSALEEENINLEQELEELGEDLKKAEEKLAENEYLYEKSAIPHNTLKESKEVYQECKRNYTRAENNISTFLEKKLPNSLELAQLKIDNARNQLMYLESSLEMDKVSEEDLEIARVKISKAEIEIENIKDDLKNTYTYSPMAGTVIDLGIKVGDQVEEGVTIGCIADLNSFIVEAMVDEIDINKVRIGQDVVITSDSFSQELEGIVKFIAPAGTNVGNINKYRTEINIKDDMGLLRPGMFVNAEIISNRVENIIAVPSIAILGDGDRYVFVLEDGVARKRYVEIGMRSLSKVEISGVEEGEYVIIGPYTILTELEEGTPVAEIGM